VNSKKCLRQQTILRRLQDGNKEHDALTSMFGPKSSYMLDRREYDAGYAFNNGDDGSKAERLLTELLCSRKQNKS
jgi:hypothetical protein